MELWIRSQDKLRLFKIKNVMISVLKLEENKIICNYEEDFEGYETYIPLGTYKTRERALEVLDEIQNKLKPQMILSKVGKPIAETCDGTVYREPDEYDIKELSTYVYEMPEE